MNLRNAFMWQTDLIGRYLVSLWPPSPPPPPTPRKKKKKIRLQTNISVRLTKQFILAIPAVFSVNSRYLSHRLHNDTVRVICSQRARKCFTVWDVVNKSIVWKSVDCRTELFVGNCHCVCYLIALITTAPCARVELQFLQSWSGMLECTVNWVSSVSLLAGSRRGRKKISASAKQKNSVKYVNFIFLF